MLFKILLYHTVKYNKIIPVEVKSPASALIAVLPWILILCLALSSEYMSGACFISFIEYNIRIYSQVLKSGWINRDIMRSLINTHHAFNERVCYNNNNNNKKELYEHESIYKGTFSIWYVLNKRVKQKWI